MPKNLLDFSKRIGLTLTQAQAEQLVAYARCVWEKKDFLNLTSAQTFEEVLSRHICDGLIAAVQVQKLGLASAQLADVGAGCGYIGMTLAIVFPQAQVTLIESLEKRCKFMNWAALQAKISNVHIKQARLGQGTQFAFDLVTERAMGTLPNIIHICLDAVKDGGVFIAFQGENPQCYEANLPEGTFIEDLSYQLPRDNKTRHLILFRKNNA